MRYVKYAALISQYVAVQSLQTFKTATMSGESREGRKEASYEGWTVGQRKWHTRSRSIYVEAPLTQVEYWVDQLPYHLQLASNAVVSQRVLESGKNT